MVGLLDHLLLSHSHGDGSSTCIRVVSAICSFPLFSFFSNKIYPDGFLGSLFFSSPSWLKWNRIRYKLLMGFESLIFLSCRIPIWYSVKLVFAAWLVLPQFKGAAFLYERFARPHIKKYGVGGSSADAKPKNH